VAVREVLIVAESSTFYYIESDDDEHAEAIARQMFIDCEPCENPSAGWSKMTSLTVSSTTALEGTQ
jgi:hypothetical protein